MMYYKLTDQDLQTYEGFQWELGKWYKIDKASRGHDLCSKSWFHCYDDSLLAVLFNPIHARIADPLLFQCNVRGTKLADSGVKFGFTQMRLVTELELPEIGLTQRIAFGILCAKQVCEDKGWNRWADAWLDGSDRTKESAEAAARAVVKLMVAVGKTAAWSAGWAAENAAWSAGWAADWAMIRSAEAAARAVAAQTVDLKKLARQAMEY